MRVFISYRRDDSRVMAALLHSELSQRAGFADVFMDTGDIDYGDDFVASIDRALADADVVVVVIGPRWLEQLQARLGHADWVRHEIATALALRGERARLGRPPLRVLPVLVGGATAPPVESLPAELAPLATINMQLFDERQLKASINSFVEAIQDEDFEGRARRLEEERRGLDAERLGVERERTRRKRARVAAVGVAFVLFLGAIAGVLDLLGLDAQSANLTMLIAHLVAPVERWSGDVVLVGIDEASERAIGRKFDTSWRAEHAIAIARAASAGARSIAFDLVLEDPGEAAANAALRAALVETRERMPVVFGVQGRGEGDDGAMLADFAKLARRGVNCAGIGLGQGRSMPLAIERAASGTARRPGGPQRSDDFVPSFGLAAYSGGGRIDLVDEIPRAVVVRLRNRQSTQKIRYYEAKTIVDPQPGCEALQPGDRFFAQLIDPYTVPPLRAAPQRVPYERLVAGDPTTLALLNDRVVLVGVMLAGRDTIPLPWPSADRWGVELFAAQVDGMASDTAIRRIPAVAEWALMSAAALLGAALAHRLRERRRALRAAVLTAVAVAWVAASVAWYRSDQQLVGVPYDLVALALGAWLANRNWKKDPA